MKINYDFPVTILGLYLEGKVEVPKKKAVVRADTGVVIGIVSEKYNLLKHATVVNTFRKALKDLEFTEKIKLAKNGSQMFAHYTIPSVRVEIAKGDVVSLQLIVKNSYDGSNALQIMLGAYRFVCQNGMIIGTHFVSFSQKHIGSESGELKIEGIKTRIEDAIEGFKITSPFMEQMSRKQARATSLEELKGIPAYLLREAQTEFQTAKDHTVWGVYNALTFAITHKIKKESPIMQTHYGKVAWKEALKLLK